jgi:MFS family permease
VSAGALALMTSSLEFLYAAWILANLASSCYGTTASLLIGEITPSGKLPLYAGVLNIISLAFSSVILLLMAPVLERIGFSPLFITVFACGAVSLLINLLVFRKHLRIINENKITKDASS